MAAKGLQPTLGGRTFLLAGVSGGIGQAVLTRFSDDRVIAIDRTPDLAGRALQNAGIAGDPERALALGADFSDPESVEAAGREIRRFTKSLDGLVNCVGIADDAAALMVPVNALQLQMQVNFIAAMQLCQLAVRLMARNRRGSIVNISSVTGMDGNRGQLAYGASKAALVNATKTLSMELGPIGIRVNCVAPGVVDTAMTRALAPEQLVALQRRIAMGRVGHAEEVAEVVHWLSSDNASYVAGQTIRVDGCM